MGRSRVVIALALGSLVFAPASAVPAEQRYVPLTAVDVRPKLEQWLTEHKVSADEKQRLLDSLNASGADGDSGGLLESVVAIWSQYDPQVRKVVNDSATLDTADIAALEGVLSQLEQDTFVTANLRGYVGRRLAEQRFYDEALVQYATLDSAQVIDPAATFFYHAVSAQEVLDVPTALTKLNALLLQTDHVPARYSTVAELMKAELDHLEPKSLGEIAQLMNDSERRLDLGRSGENVQEVQDRIVAGLDELIKKIEGQQGGGGGGGGGQGGSSAPPPPAGENRGDGSPSPNDVDAGKSSRDRQWGDLPEKQQAQAKNLINREFPSHYRQAIETYFKKLAGRPAAPGK